MWLNLAKVSPDLLADIRVRPDLLDALFFDEAGDPPAGFDPRSDVLGCDYRTLSAVAEGMAAQEEPGVDWREKYVWLRRATGDNEADMVADYEFTYGPAFAFDPATVQAVLDGLNDEGWAFDDLDMTPEELEAAGIDLTDDAEDVDADDDDGDDDDIDKHEYDDFVDLVPFFAAAAREGKAIVGGIA